MLRRRRFEVPQDWAVTLGAGLITGIDQAGERITHAREFLDAVLQRLEGLGIPVEGWHDEAAPGQVELNLDPTDPVTACDRVIRVDGGSAHPE